ncbi:MULTISPECIES: EexN family lipoprotein [Dickeya]|uniref:EexN family lipoprotein n=1 Tax=Dickeya TaxID=204037 RepID=UPI002E284CD3|nr:EexN family lipoprotein [Dickeya parazeae]
MHSMNSNLPRRFLISIIERASMKTSLCIFSVIWGAFCLTGCDNPKSTQWYKAHPDEMNQRYQACESSGEDSQDCKNARAARFELRQEKAKVPNLN